MSETAFQVNAFQNNAFQVGGDEPPVDIFDQGSVLHSTIIDRGPTFGNTMLRIAPQFRINAAGFYTIGAHSDVAVILINVADTVLINLPSVSTWLNQVYDQHPNNFGGVIWIKDLGGNAATFPITVFTNPPDKIDGVTPPITLAVNRGILRLCPLNDLSGWAKI